MKVLKISILFCCLSSAYMLRAQSDIATVVQGGVDNASVIGEEYLRPLGNALGAGLNSGWYSTGKTHKPLGFDITFNTNFINIPTEHQTFDVSELDLYQFEPADPNADNESPTLFGKKENGADMIYYIDNPALGGRQNIDTISMPPGLGVQTVPMPDIKIGLGIVKKTELMFRFMPEYKVWGKTNASINYWGLGLKHNLKQWIPGIKEVPFFNLSIMGAYSKMAMDVKMGEPIYPEYGIIPLPTDYDRSDYENQGISFEAKAITTNLIASIDVPFVSFFVSGGYNTNKTSLLFSGKYGVPDIENNQLVIKNIEDPIDIDFKNNYFQGKIGMKLKLAVVHLHGNYTLGKYPVINAGLGISVR